MEGKYMITFLNFNARQLTSTVGFDRKVNKMASTLGIKKVLFSEIINIEDSSLDVLLIDEKMYLHKVHFYSTQAIKTLNDELTKLFQISDSDLDIDNYKDCNLFDEINCVLSRTIELLNIENTVDIDKLEGTTSSQFGVSLENFTYEEVYYAIKPLVHDLIFHVYNFKILNLTKTDVEVLVITSDCKLYQFSIHVTSSYTKFINRYISAIVPPDKFADMRLNLRNFDFSRALKSTLPTYNSSKEKLDTSSFLAFLIQNYKKDIKKEGFGNEGLKNVHKFLFDISASEEEANSKIRACYMQAKTYEQKKQLPSNEEGTT